jgi:hypothetical protein
VVLLATYLWARNRMLALIGSPRIKPSKTLDQTQTGSQPSASSSPFSPPTTPPLLCSWSLDLQVDFSFVSLSHLSRWLIVLLVVEALCLQVCAYAQGVSQVWEG